MGAARSGPGAEKTERNAEMLKMYARGRTQQQVADHFGISQAAVSEIIRRYRAASRIDKTEEIERAADLIDELIADAMKLAEMEGAPVTAGKDGLVVVDPERKGPHDEPVYVRDYSGRIAAINTIKGLLERKSKLLGLDAATKTEVSGTVSYLLPGVNPETLK